MPPIPNDSRRDATLMSEARVTERTGTAWSFEQPLWSDGHASGVHAKTNGALMWLSSSRNRSCSVVA